MLIYYICFSPLTWLCLIRSRFIHLTRTGSNSFFSYGWIIFHWVCVPHHLYSSVSGHLGCFCVLAIVNSAALNIGVHVSFSIMVSSRYRWLINTWKDAQCHSLEKCKSKLQWDVTLHQSEWPSWKSLQINAGEDVQKREPFALLMGM